MKNEGNLDLSNIQPQSFPKQVSGWMLLYAMFLQSKG